MTGERRDRRRILEERAQAASKAACALCVGVDVPLEALDSFLAAGLAESVLEALEDLREAEERLARVRQVATYPAQRGLAAGARFVMSGREVLAVLGPEEAWMTLRELMARGVIAVRRLEWAFPNDHLVLVQNGDGSYAGVGELRSIAAPEALGLPVTRHIVLLPLLDTDRWEPYEPKV